MGEMNNNQRMLADKTHETFKLLNLRPEIDMSKMDIPGMNFKQTKDGIEISATGERQPLSKEEKAKRKKKKKDVKKQRKRNRSKK